MGARLPAIAGDIVAEVLASTAVSIHGDQYYDLTLRRAETGEDAAPFGLRAPAHACEAPPTAGQRVRVSLLMGQVTRVRRADPC